MGRRATTKRIYSRREFLKGVPLGIAGAFVASLVFSRFIPSILTRRRQPPIFPEGSIFTPARGRRNRV